MAKIKHVKSVMVRCCDSASCQGDEEGCNSTECRRPKWRRYSHSTFVHIYGRCPRGCRPEGA